MFCSRNIEMNDETSAGNDNPDLAPREFRYWAEFCCWITLAIAPFLYWVNGPSVSMDQLIIRSCLVAAAAIGALGLRAYAWCHWALESNKLRSPDGDDKSVAG
jgi:hypothetical protein